MGNESSRGHGAGAHRGRGVMDSQKASIDHLSPIRPAIQFTGWNHASNGDGYFGAIHQTLANRITRHDNGAVMRLTYGPVRLSDVFLNGDSRQRQPVHSNWGLPRRLPWQQAIGMVVFTDTTYQTR